MIPQSTQAQSCRPTASFSSYETLTKWLRDEIGEVPMSVVRKCRPPAALGNLDGLTEGQVNQRLKEMFIATFMSPQAYRRQITYLSGANPRETRLKIRAPLPSTDFGILLEPVPGRHYLDRAAALVQVATSLHLRFEAGELSTTLSRRRGGSSLGYRNLFATFVRPRADTSSLHLSHDSRHINVLWRGNAYRLAVIDKNEPICVGSIRRALEQIVSLSARAGMIGLLRTAPLDDAFAACEQLTASVMEPLYDALFTLCLDGVAGEHDAGRDALFTSIFSGNCHNRWYGGSQIVVRSDGEAALLFSYMCGVDGVQAFEVAHELQSLSSAMQPTTSDAGAWEHDAERIDVGMSPVIAERLRAASAPLFHDRQSLFTLPLGLDFFKGLRISPNNAVHYLLLLAFKDAGGLDYLPESSQAVVVGEQFWGGVQLDWLRARPEPLRRFVGQPSNPALFRAVLDQHRQLLKHAKQRLTPFLFFENDADPAHLELARFYLRLGREEAVGAYRHYLCPLTRDPAALDLITSALRLWDGIALVGRPGTRSRLVGLSGTHIMFESERMHIVFTPAPAWEGRLPVVMHHLHLWMQRLGRVSGIAGDSC